MKAIEATKDFWVPVAGYEGIYWINPSGEIRNAKQQVLAPIKGQWIELRSNGQREICLILQLIEENFGGN